MRVFIITMDDPVQTLPFIKKVIEERKDWIVGVAIAKGGRLTTRKNHSKWAYLLSLLLIMGPLHFAKNSFITVRYKLVHLLAKIWPAMYIYTFNGWLNKMRIPVQRIDSANNPAFLEYLQNIGVDIIINQSQALLKPALLKIPSIGVINRHNALLPKNRGRLTPFWVLYKGEEETGVSIHFVTEKLDAGDIIVQKKFPVKKSDTFNTLVKKNYSIAPLAMIEALDKLSMGKTGLLPNKDKFASYNSTPTLKEAWKFFLRRLPGATNITN